MLLFLVVRASCPQELYQLNAQDSRITKAIQLFKELNFRGYC